MPTDTTKEWYEGYVRVLHKDTRDGDIIGVLSGEIPELISEAQRIERERIVGIVEARAQEYKNTVDKNLSGLATNAKAESPLNGVWSAIEIFSGDLIARLNSGEGGET